MINQYDYNTVKTLRERALQRGVLSRSDRRVIGSLLRRGMSADVFSSFVDKGQLALIKMQGRRT